MDQAGTAYGTLARERPGMKFGEQRTYEPRDLASGEGPWGPLGRPKTMLEAHQNLARAKEQLKNLNKAMPKGRGGQTSEFRRQWMGEIMDKRKEIAELEEAIASELKPVKNWATQALGDVRTLFEEAPK